MAHVKGISNDARALCLACLPACLPLVPSYLAGITWEKTTKKKKEEKKGASKQIFTLSKALGNSKDAPQDWRKKSLFSCLSCLTCTAHAPALRPSLLCLPCRMRLPHRLLLVYAIVLNRSAWDLQKEQNKRCIYERCKPRSNLTFAGMKQKVSESDATQVLGGYCRASWFECCVQIDICRKVTKSIEERCKQSRRLQSFLKKQKSLIRAMQAKKEAT
jgi:hypothetical protein